MKQHVEDPMDILKNLFNQIDWSDRFARAIHEECRNAYLHGLCDAAYDEWGDAGDFVDILCQERDCHPCDIEIWHLQKRWPDVIFDEHQEWGLRFARGRLFSIRDYQVAKEAIAQLGKDSFEADYTQRYGKALKPAYYLWEN